MKKSLKTIIASIYTSLAALVFGGFTAFAASGSSNKKDAVSNILTWGEDIIADIQKIGQLIAVGAIIILAIVVISAGRGWAERLKSGAAGILVGIALLGFGVDIVAGLFA